MSGPEETEPESFIIEQSAKVWKLNDWLLFLYIRRLDAALIAAADRVAGRIAAAPAGTKAEIIELRRVRFGEPREDCRDPTPLIWEHVNPCGRFELDMDARLPTE
jgi:hypothetical protein